MTCPWTIIGHRPPCRPHGRARDNRGFSLIETMVGLGILLVVAAGVLPLGLLTISISENHGHLMARSVEYAQDKLEQLMALSYGDSVSDTRLFPAGATGGSGLAPGGSVNLAAPVAQYVDYLSIEGTLLPSGTGGAAPANWYYQRVWQIEELGSADANCPPVVSAAQRCLKRISVTATVRTPAMGGRGLTPRASVTALKAYPF
jgi:prepilin-type N-terminal cleavage/methylation domain-containing protein